VSPPGNYAADGAVFLTGGNAPVVNARGIAVDGPQSAHGRASEQRRLDRDPAPRDDNAVSRPDMHAPRSRSGKRDIRILEAGQSHQRRLQACHFRFGGCPTPIPPAPRRADSAERAPATERRRHAARLRNTKFPDSAAGLDPEAKQPRNAQRARRELVAVGLHARPARCRCGGHGDTSGPTRDRDGRHRSRWRAARQPRPQRFVKKCRTPSVSVSNANAGPLRSESMPGELLGRGTAVMVSARRCAEAGRRRPGRRRDQRNVTFTPPTHLTSDPAR